MISIVWEPWYDPSDHIISCFCYLSILASGARSDIRTDTVLEYDISPSPHILSRPRQQADIYTEIREDGSNDSNNEEDECTPLIPQKRPQHKIKRNRHATYPFGENSQEEAESAPVVYSNSCCNIHSYPHDNLKEISLLFSNSYQNTVAGSGFINFTLRTEPHNILKSFNIQDKAPIIKKVKEWDLKYRGSNTPKVSKPMSAYSFLPCHASDSPDILKKVQCWEMRDGM